MSAIEFATQWAGYRFRIPEEIMPTEMAKSMTDGYFHPSGKLIGYIDTARVVLELETLKEFGWPVHDGVVFTLNKKFFHDKQFPIVLAANYKSLIPPKSKKEIEREALERAKTKCPSPYPQICSVCNSPARIYGKRIMCSNSLCKTRQDVLKSITNGPSKKTYPVRCLISGCNGVAIYVNKAVDRDSYYLECSNGHDFDTVSSHFKIDNIVFFTRFNGDYDFIWNGTTWEKHC